MPVTIDGELGAAWIHAHSVKVVFVFHVALGQIHEIEQIADPEVLVALNVVRIRVNSSEVDAPSTDPSNDLPKNEREQTI